MLMVVIFNLSKVERSRQWKSLYTLVAKLRLQRERELIIRIAKAWAALNKLQKIWKSTLSDILKRRLFRSVVESILLYGSETWTLTKRLEKSFDLHKNASSRTQQVLATTSDETRAIWKYSCSFITRKGKEDSFCWSLL